MNAYKSAGVNVEAGYQSTRLIKEDVKRTLTPYVLSELGGFGGLVELPEGYKQPVLVSGTDGVGTKLLIAMQMKENTTIGIDAVAMCVNDIICSGAKPLFFLDYIACGTNEPERIAEIVSGVAEGCVQSECALVGGETAEMPGMYLPDDYDIAGFAVGVADKDKLITGQKIKAGDVLVGLPSAGVHSNGFSLVRKIVRENKLHLDEEYPELGEKLGEALLRPTMIYVKALKDLPEKYDILGMSHITGGGFYENIPRMLPEGLGAVVDANAIPVPKIFSFLQECGGLSDEAMYSTFNMGVGMVCAVAPENADGLVKELQSRGTKAAKIGTVEESADKIRIDF
ncbi:MAG: phosphoribosylformylglycinamidine cyclo-ligase [Eubacteriaceae bacterium]